MVDQDDEGGLLLAAYTPEGIAADGTISSIVLIHLPEQPDKGDGWAGARGGCPLVAIWIAGHGRLVM
ncbi:hypothetical protein [Streptomyces sp. MS2.AVA.5]|uniref:Uncharacterized protein n=1 Tax=Streptomyces achmelvichensis TaxID=3134111 RepID=A0ACC6PLF3_9ACTN